MNKLTYIIYLLSVSPCSYAHNIIIDVYGAECDHAKAILKQYGKEIVESEHLASDNSVVTDKIKKTGGYLWVYMHTTTYPQNNNVYTTVEVIEPDQADRLRFVNPKIYINHSQVKDDLINKMIEYDKQAAELALIDQSYTLKHPCPVYHCVFGFDHPKLRPYLKLFNKGVIKDKKLILDTLNHDPDPDRRGAAAFLVGHFKSAHEIVSILAPHVTDQNVQVRNNVIRVFSLTIDKENITKIDVMPFADLLNSPYGSDRNKALSVLYSAAKSPENKKTIIEKCINNLLSILRLKQPNNHDYAFLILKRVSGKKYGEYDFGAWDKWFNSVKIKQVFKAQLTN